MTPNATSHDAILSKQACKRPKILATWYVVLAEFFLVIEARYKVLRTW
jgi:hypothetical protein